MPDWLFMILVVLLLFGATAYGFIGFYLNDPLGMQTEQDYTKPRATWKPWRWRRHHFTDPSGRK